MFGIDQYDSDRRPGFGLCVADHLSTDTDNQALLRGIMGLAVAFKRQVIAEGVETIAQGQMLLSIGCVLGQGFGIARPMPPTEVPTWLASRQPDASWTAAVR